MCTYIQSLFDSVVVISPEEAVDRLWLVEAEKSNVALDDVRGRSYLLFGQGSVCCKWEHAQEIVLKRRHKCCWIC